jgi:hypothetical protein
MNVLGSALTNSADVLKYNIAGEFTPDNTARDRFKANKAGVLLPPEARRVLKIWGEV